MRRFEEISELLPSHSYCFITSKHILGGKTIDLAAAKIVRSSNPPKEGGFPRCPRRRF